MKSEKGITLISVILYVIVMLLVVTIASILTGYFYNNIDINNTEQNANVEFTKFNSFFTEEVNIRGNTILESDTEGTSTGQKYIVFSTGNQYTYIKNNKSIYKNNSKIASDIEEFNLKINNSDSKTTIKIELTSGNITKTTTYALKN